ncbi:hypothetical protein ACIGCM_03675 [Pseudomonas sp. NPDC078700]|uniref:hypothetical protein n=1 Tax=Pseudomonas sp. NPDC078700 TaxID=3364424 RepID=UPI0037C8DA0B
MFKVEADGLAAQLAALTDLEKKQLPFATALTLTRTAEKVEQRLVGEMRTVFDRPTSWTLNSLRVFPATKQKLVARVWMKNEADKSSPATKWLSPEIYGGPRQDKRSEAMLRQRGILPANKYIVPGAGAQLDQFGNLKRGQITKVLSGIGGFTQQGYTANASGSRRSRAKGNARRYFVMYDSQRQPIGIAERTGRGPNSRAKLRIIMAFVSKPSYSKAFNFFSIAEREAEAQLPVQWRLALAQALSTARR